MQKFVYEYATKVYFGEGAAKEHLAAAVSGYGKNVMLAYGGGSVKKNGIYDEVKKILEDAGKKVTDFGGIRSNPTYAKVQEGAALAEGKRSILSLRWAAAQSSTAVRSWRRRQKQIGTCGRWRCRTASSRMR